MGLIELSFIVVALLLLQTPDTKKSDPEYLDGDLVIEQGFYYLVSSFGRRYRLSGNISGESGKKIRVYGKRVGGDGNHIRVSRVYY